MQTIRKAVIPAAGHGTRMLPITKAQPKEMIPVVHKPVIQYVIEEAWQAGITEILIILGRGKYAIENHFDLSNVHTSEKYLNHLEEILKGLNIFYIRQKKLLGLGDAVSYAESFVSDEPFALLLGDTITIPSCVKELIQVHSRYPSSIIAVEEVSAQKVSSYGIIGGNEVEPGVYKVNSLIEKPEVHEAPSRMAILGSYVLTPEIFPCIRKTKPGKTGEIQLTDALNWLKDEQDVYAYMFRGRRYDIGNITDWIKANIELALHDEEVGPEIREFIRGLKI